MTLIAGVDWADTKDLEADWERFKLLNWRDLGAPPPPSPANTDPDISKWAV